MLVRTVALLVATVFVSSLPFSNVSAQVANPRRCIDGMNKAGAKVAAAAHSDAKYCTKLAFRGSLPAGTSAQQCLTADLRGRVARASSRVETIDATRCAPPPSFGYAGAPAVIGAGSTLAAALAADLFGLDLDAAIFPAKCQARVVHNLAKMSDAELRTFGACKKAGLADGTITDTASLASCLDAITADQEGKIARVRARLAADDARHCELYNRDILFPGYCAFADDFLPCVDVRLRCRVCEALNQMDALGVDCEAFDDGLANGSCGPCMPDPDGLCCNASDRDACGFCGGTGFRCGWSEISVAPTHACGLKIDGSIACWGHNFGGELNAPAGSFTQIVSGGSAWEVTNRGHSCALLPDQTAVCWGRDDFGQASPPAEPFVQLSAGAYHTCGLRPDGSITCWGLDDYGQATAPAGTFTSISASRRSNCALRDDGELACWGDNFYGNLTPLPGPFIDVEAAALQTYATLPDQTLVGWGEPSPQFDPPSGPFVEVDGGVVNACGRRPDNSLVCWPDPPSPVELTAPPGTFVQLDAGERIYCAVRSDTTLVCWGDLYTQSGGPPK